MHVLLHLSVLRRVFCLLEVLFLAKDLLGNGDFVCGLASVHDLVFESQFAFLKQPDVDRLVYLTRPPDVFLVLLVQRFLPFPGHNSFLFFDYLGICTRLHKFLQVQFIGLSHLRRFFEVALVRCKVRVLPHYAFVFPTLHILVRSGVLQVFGLHLRFPCEPLGRRHFAHLSFS